MSDENRRADRANIARLRWRASVHRLNGDEPGARLNESHADTCERLLDARESGDEIALRLAKGAVRAERQAWREVRQAFGPQSFAVAFDAFNEPSDDELLEG